MDQARKAATEAQAAANAEPHRVEVATRTVALIGQELTDFVAANFAELDRRHVEAQAKARDEIEEHQDAMLAAVERVFAINNERANLRRAIGRMSDDLPRFGELEELRREGRRRKQRVASVA